MSKVVDEIREKESKRRAAAAAEAISAAQHYRVLANWENGVESAPAYFPTLAEAEVRRDMLIAANARPFPPEPPRNWFSLFVAIEQFTAGEWKLIKGSERECMAAFVLPKAPSEKRPRGRRR